MRHGLPLLALVATLSAVAILPKAAPMPGPAIRLLSASRAVPDRVRLNLELSNPRTTPVWFPGYRANSFDPPLPKDRIEPLWITESRRAGIWELLEARSTWCGTGFEQSIALPAKAKGTFEVELPARGWEETRVCVPLYFTKVELATKLELPTTPVIPRQLVEKTMQAEKTPPVAQKDGG